MSDPTFATPRHRVLYQMAVDGWANESLEVENAGLFARISNSPAELAEVVDAFESEIADAGLTDTSQLIGHFLLMQTPAIVIVTEFDNDAELLKQYRLYTAVRWTEGDVTVEQGGDE